MTEVNLVVKVVDKVSTETVRIVSRFADQMKRAASAVKSAFQFVDTIGNVFEKVGKSLGKLFDMLKEAAPDAREFALALSDIERASLTRTVEAMNRLKATMEGMFLKVVAEFGPTISLYLDSLTTWVLTNKDAIKNFVVGLVGFIGDMIAAIGKMFFALARLVSDKLSLNLEDIIPDPPEIAARVQALNALKFELADLQEQEKRGRAELLKTAFSYGDVTSLERERSIRLARIEGIESQIRVTEELIKTNREAFYKDPSQGLPKLEANFENLGLKAIPPEAEDASKSFDALADSILRYAEARATAELDIEERIDRQWEKLIEQLADEVDAQKKQDVEIRKILREFYEWEDDQREKEKAAERRWWDEYIDGWMRVLDEEERAKQEKRDRELAAHRELIEREAAADRERIQKAVEEAQKLQGEIDRLSSVITDNFMAAFDSIIQGTESVGRAFTRMVGSILADIGRMMAAEAMKKFISSVLGSLFSGPTYSTQSGGAFDAFGGEISPLYDTLPGQASGGFVPGRNAFMVGERGPELFVPPSSGNIITAARSGGNSVSGVTINVNGAQDPGRTAREVKAALMSLMSSDPAARQRLRVVASGGGVA